MIIFLNSFYQPYEIISQPTAAGDDYQVLFFMETIPFANSDVGPKVVHPKYYKHYAYALAHEMGFVCFSLFWPNHGSIKNKTSSNIGSKISEIFSTALTAQSAQKQERKSTRLFEFL